MTDQRKIEARFGLDVSDVKTGTAEASAAVEGMASGIVNSTGKAGKSLAGLGIETKTVSEQIKTAFSGVDDEAEKALKGADRSTKAFVSQLQQSAIKIAGANRDIIESFEARAAINPKIDQSVIKPYLDGLKSVAAQQKAMADEAALAAASVGKTIVPRLNEMGMTAKATAAALRQVPAQFTDIVVSLQGGQAPLTVLLQQGGQLKDIFGGVGAAAKALGGYIAGLINPYTVAATVIGTLAYAAYSASEQSKELGKALILTGNKSDTTLSKLTAVAGALSESGVSAGTATAALLEFVNAGVNAGDNLQKFTKAAIDLERLGGQAIKETAKDFAELAKDPLSGLEKLSLATYKQIEALLEQGDKIGAVRVAQEALNKSNEDVVVSLKAQQGPLDTAIDYWKRYGVEVWNAARGLAQAAANSPKTGDEERRDLQKRRDTYAAQGYDTTNEDARLEYFRRLDEAQQQTAANIAKELRLKNLLADFEKNDDALKRQRDRNKLIAENTELLKANLITQKQYDDTLKRFDAKGAKKPKEENQTFAQEQGKSYAKYVEEFGRAAIDAQIHTDGLTKSQGNLVKMLTDPVFQSMPETWRQMGLQAAYAAIAVEQNEAAIAAADKVAREYTAGAKESANAIQKKLQALGDETAAYKIATEQNISLAEAIDVVAIARLNEEVIRAKIAGNYDAVKELEREIELRKQLRGELNKQDAYKKEVEAGKEAARAVHAEWKRGWDETDRIARDAFTSWADGGTNAADAIGKALKKALLSAIYEATLRPLAFQLYTSIAGGAPSATGGYATGAAGGAIGGAVGAFGTGASYGAQSLLANGLGGTLSAGGQMIGAGSYAAGFGTIAGALAPIAVGLAALNGYLESRPESSANLGDSSATYGTNGARLALQTTNGLNADTTALTAALQSSYVSAAKSLGIGLAQTNYNVNVNNGADAKNPNTVIDSTVNGRTYSSGEVSQKDSAGLQLAASRAVLNALQASDMPKYMATVLNGVVASTATQAQIDGALAYAKALKDVRTAMDESRTPVEVLQDAVNKGFADLGTSADSFKKDFVKAIDAGLSQENFSNWNSLKTTMDELAAAAKTAADALKATQTATASAISNIVKSIDAMHAAVTAADAKVQSAQDSIRSGYLDAQANLNTLLLQASQNTLAFTDSIAAFLDSVSPKASGSLTSLKAQLSTTAVLAQGGDSTAQGTLVSQAQSVLAAARASSTSAVDYARNEAFVRNLLSGVQKSLLPQTQLAKDAAPDLSAQIADQQKVVDRYAALAEATGTSIVESTDKVGTAIDALRAAYDAAKDEQIAANLKLTVALAALDTLGLSEAGLKLILAAQTSDFAKALDVTNADIKTLTDALGLSQDQVNALTDKLNIKVADDVYAALGESLGPVSTLYADLGASVGAPPEFFAKLGTALGLTPIQLDEINSALNLTADQKLALQTVLTLSREQTDALSTALGYDNTAVAGLATAIGLSKDAVTSLTNLDTAIGLSLGADAIIKSLPTALGLSDPSNATIRELASKIGFSDKAIDAAKSLETSIGFSDAASNTVANLGNSVGLMTYVMPGLASAIGLSESAATALAGFAEGLAAQGRANTISAAVGSKDPISAIYQLLFGRTPEAATESSQSAKDYWSSTGLGGMALYNAIHDAAAKTIGAGQTMSDYATMKLRGYAIGTNYVPSDGPAYLHKGEAVVPAAYNPAAGGNANAALEARIDALTMAMTAVQKAVESSAASSKKTADTLTRVTRDGNALLTTVA